MNSLFKSSFPFLLCSALLTASASAFACDYHDKGFGMYSMNGSHMNQQFRSASSPQLKLIHDRKLVVKQSNSNTIEIKYHLPAQFNDASLRFTFSDGIEIPNPNDAISIDELNGTFMLQYVATKLGKQHILIWADATRQNLPFSKVQKIDLTVI